jgi:hypothetical protein
VTAYQIGDIEAGDFPILNDPAPADHHAVGTVRAAQDERGERIAAAGKSQLVEPEQREIGLHAEPDFADVGPPDASRGAFGRPA